MEEHCIICGEPIPEGRQVCQNCERKWKNEQTKNDDERKNRAAFGF